MTHRLFLKISLCLILTGAAICSKSQQSVTDSLLQIPYAQRDTAWSDMAVKASFGMVYNDPASSEQLLRQVYHLAKSKNFDDRISQIRLIQGIAKDVMNQPDSAIWFYRSGLTAALERNDRAMMASAYNNIGLVYWNQEYLDSALIYYRLSEDLFKQEENSRGLLSTMNNMGLIYQSLDRNKSAAAYFQRVIKLAEENENDYFLALACQNLAGCFSFTNQFDSARYYVHRAESIQLEIDDTWGLAKTYHTLGYILSNLDSLRSAEAAFLKAIDINTKFDNAHALASNYFSLAEVYHKLKRNDKRLESLHKAKNLEGSYTDDELRNKVSADYNLLLVREWNKEIGDQLEKSFVGTDSLYRARLEGKVLELQEEYEAEKRKQELRIKDLEIAEQNRAVSQRERLIWGLALLVLVLIVLGWMYFRYRAKLNKLRAAQRLALERTRISRDLHDNIGARITAISTRIDLLEGHDDQPSELKKIQTEAHGTISVLRDTIWAMHSESFSIAQFMTRLVEYARQTLPDSIEVKTSYEPGLEDRFLNASQALNLFRVAQEALQNSMKHSGASQIDIEMWHTDNHYHFKISDNGAGCKIPHDEIHDGFGLQNMRERIAEINGEIEFSSTPGEGFQVLIVF